MKNILVLIGELLSVIGIVVMFAIMWIGTP